MKKKKLDAVTEALLHAEIDLASIRESLMKSVDRAYEMQDVLEDIDFAEEIQRDLREISIKLEWFPFNMPDPLSMHRSHRLWKRHCRHLKRVRAQRGAAFSAPPPETARMKKFGRGNSPKCGRTNLDLLRKRHREMNGPKIRN